MLFWPLRATDWKCPKLRTPSGQRTLRSRCKAKCLAYIGPVNASETGCWHSALRGWEQDPFQKILVNRIIVLYILKW